MARRQILIGILIVLLLVGLALLSFLTLHKPLKVVHYHAAFQVYNNGILVNFSQWKYMDTVPCSANGKGPQQPDQIMKAHLHELVGDVVHVHREPAYWKDLFKNIKYPIPANVQGYINGKKVDDPLDKQIHPYDIALFFIGPHKNISYYLLHAPTVAHIKKVESTSELCGT